MAKTKEELAVWRFLANMWGFLTAAFFLLTFFKILDLISAIKSLAIIYISVLSIFAGIKEFNRWNSKNFFSKHNGEIFVILWTTMMVVFIFLNAYDCEKYQIPAEFTATYMSILGIYAISRKSKYLKLK